MADPTFQYVGFYYPDILAALLLNKSRILPAHTETDPNDPIVALAALFALMGHQQSARLDHAVREVFPTTAQQRGSFVEIGRTFGAPLASAVAAEVDLVADLAAELAAPVQVVAPYSVGGTEGDAASPPILFGYDSATGLTVGPTGAWVVVGDDGGVFADLSLPAAAWSGVVAQDAVYFTHAGIMFDKIRISISGSPTAPTAGRWEYRDDLRAVSPDAVTPAGGGLEINTNTAVGASRADGLEVVVRCLLTGVEETITIDYTGGYNRAPVIGYLGQSSPSLDPTDYEIRPSWVELPGVVDGTAGLTQSGDLTWTLPQDADRRWASDDVNGHEGFAIRWRVVVAGSATAPTISAVEVAARTTWSVLWPARQGERVSDALGTTDSGSASQSFTLARSPFMDLDGVTVDGQAYALVDNFLSSAAYDKHHTLQEQPDGSWDLTLGDGTNGAIPPPVVAVAATYWIGGDVSGNVGSQTITRDRTGNPRIRNLRNPRAAAGWVAAEGSTEADRARLRTAIPAGLRALSRAVSREDYQTLAVSFRTADGSQVAVRARAVEEGLGLRTVDLICVGPGGSAPTASDLAELDDYFNGEVVGLQRIGGVGLPDVVATARSYNQVAIDVTASIDVLAQYASTAQAVIEAALTAELSATALRMELDAATGAWARGPGYWWEFEGEVSESAIQTIIHTAHPGVIKVTLSGWSDVALTADQLPIVGTLAISITAVTL